MTKIERGHVIPGITDENGYLIDPATIERLRVLTMDVIAVIEPARLDDVATILSSLLGQNLAAAVRSTGIPLETLVDRTMFAVRTSAQHELTNAPDVDSHHEH